MTQQLFDELTADAPPNTIDVRAIVRKEKRRRNLFRASGAAVVVVAAGAAFVAFQPTAAPAPVVALPATVSPAAPTTPTGFRLVADNQAAIKATAASLRASLDDAVRHTAPGLNWLAIDSKLSTPNGQPPHIFGDNLTKPTDQMFTGTTGISVNGRTGELHLDIISADQCTGGSLAKCGGGNLYACTPAAQKCVSDTPANGRHRRVETDTSEGGFVSQQTTLELADGRALMLTVDNQFIPPGATNQNSVHQSATPLTAAQVTAIATKIGDQILA